MKNFKFSGKGIYLKIFFVKKKKKNSKKQNV